MKLFNHIVSMSMRHLFRQLPAIGTLSFFIFSFFIFHSSISAQTVGSWQIYPAYTVSTHNIPAGNRIYALMESKLMAYDTEDETTTTFDWQQQLNGISISFMHYSPDAHRLILIYVLVLVVRPVTLDAPLFRHSLRAKKTAGRYVTTESKGNTEEFAFIEIH